MALKKRKVLGNYDEFDSLILHELRQNCKLSVRELANKIGLHPNTLMQRIKRLENDGVIVKYIAEIDYSKLGYESHAIIAIRVRMGKSWEEPIRELSKITEIEALYPITGGPDALAIFRGKNLHDLAEVLRKIQATGIVVKTTTYLIVDEYKESYEYDPFKIGGL